MEYFNQVKNPLLKENNSLKLKTKLATTTLLSSVTGIYSKEVTVPFPKDIDELAQTYVVFDLVMTPSANSFNSSYIAFKLLADILFETSQRLNLMHIKPEYHIVKFDKLAGTPLYDLIQKGCTLPSSFTTVIAPATTTSGSCTISIPLFLFYSMDPTSFLSIRNVENLQLRFRTNTAANIGMLTAGGTLLTLTSLSISVVQESYNKNPSLADQFQIGKAHISVPRTIKNSYNIFYEDQVPITSGSTSVTVLLRCPYPAVNILGTIFSQNTRASINSYSLKVRNSYLVGGSNAADSISTDLSYNLFNPSVSFIENKNFEHYFNRINTTFSNTGLLTFSAEDTMFPVYVTLYYTAPNADAILYLFSEYITNHTINDYRKISSNDTDSLLLKTNSVLAPI